MVTELIRTKMIGFSRSSSLLLLALSLLSCGSPDAENEGQRLSVSSKMTVNTTAGLVSIEAQNALLRDLLMELSQRTQITISMPDEMKADRVTLALQQRPLEEAFRQVLVGRSYSFLYRQEKGREVITGVRLFAQQRPMVNIGSSGPQTGVSSRANQGQPPSGSPRAWGRADRTTGGARPVAVRDDLPLDELKRSLRESQDPAHRIATLDAISNRVDDGPVNPIVSQVLSDMDQDVRETALNLLRTSFDPVPISPLAQMAATENNAELRMEAMTLMTDQLFQDGRTKEEWMTVRASLNKSLVDADPDIRDQAEQLLSQLSDSAQTTTKQGFGRG